MADTEEGDDNKTRGNDWEVVSLTASAYAAAPGPKEVELMEDNANEDHMYKVGEAETTSALFMSGHFVFPPSQHENLPLEPDYSEIIVDDSASNVDSGYHVEEGNISVGKDDGSWLLKGLNVSEDFPGLQFLDSVNDQRAVSDKDFEESEKLQDLHLIDPGQNIYSTDAYSSFHSETGLGDSTVDIHEVDESVDQGSHLPTDDSHSHSRSPDQAIEGKYLGPELPCEAWWKRRAVSLYDDAKETNTFWSIFVAAAVMGLVILGQRYQERWQVLQLKWQTSLNGEKSSRVLGPISRLKDVIVGGHQRGSLMKGTSPNEN